MKAKQLKPDYGTYLARYHSPESVVEISKINSKPIVIQANKDWLIGFSVVAEGVAYEATIEIQNGTKQKAFEIAQQLIDGATISIYVRSDKRYQTPGLSGLPREWVCPLWLSPPPPKTNADLEKLNQARLKRLKKAQKSNKNTAVLAN
jgi:hypothetical protein